MNRKFKPLVYICAPFSGDRELNIKNATKLAEYAYNKGCIPLTPHLLFPFMDDSDDNQRSNALLMDKVLLGKCQEVWVLDGNITNGMIEEINVAKQRRQTIKYIDMEEIQ